MPLNLSSVGPFKVEQWQVVMLQILRIPCMVLVQDGTVSQNPKLRHTWTLRNSNEPPSQASHVCGHCIAVD